MVRLAVLRAKGGLRVHLAGVLVPRSALLV